MRAPDSKTCRLSGLGVEMRRSVFVAYRASFLGSACLSALLLAPSLARADGYAGRYVGPAPTNWIVNSNNQISVDFVESHIDYRETFAGAFLDGEKGWVPGVSVTGSIMTGALGIPNLYAFGRFTYLNGDTDYRASGGPVLANTDGARVRDEDFRVGVGLSLSRDFMLTPYVGFGWHDWGRNLSGPFGYHEEYSHGYVGGGLLLQYSPTARLVMSANGLIGRTFDSSMTTSRTAGGALINPFTYDLGDSATVKAGAGADYAFTKQIHGNVGIDYTTFKYGQSPVAPDGTLEPNSRTHDATLRVGLGFAFYEERDYRPLK
jgi:opacity protein-like surface antigen